MAAEDEVAGRPWRTGAPVDVTAWTSSGAVAVDEAGAGGIHGARRRGRGSETPAEVAAFVVAAARGGGGGCGGRDFGRGQDVRG